MYTNWKNKTDPTHHPVRSLAAIWQERTAGNPRLSGRVFTAKQFGQFKQLKDSLGDVTQYVIEWVLRPDNWWRFSQQVRAEAKLYRVPDDPDIAFLLFHRNRALRIMRQELRESMVPADRTFCMTLDRLRFEQLKALVLVYAFKAPQCLEKIAAASTLLDMQRVFIEVIENN